MNIKKQKFTHKIPGLKYNDMHLSAQNEFPLAFYIFALNKMYQICNVKSIWVNFQHSVHAKINLHFLKVSGKKIKLYLKSCTYHIAYLQIQAQCEMNPSAQVVILKYLVITRVHTE